MPTLTLGQHLDLFAQSGESLIVPTPPECQVLWERGKAEGLPLGSLYVVKVPLCSRTIAAYNHESGDVWVVDHPDDPLCTQRSLLHELAHAGRGRHVPPDDDAIDAHCDEEIATQRYAGELARVWGLNHLMTLADVEAYCDLMEELRGTLQAAGLLAGSLRYSLASVAYYALWALAARQGWSREVLGDALYGIAEEERINEQVLDFDRSRLRGRWSLGWGDGTADLGPLALPEIERSATTLRDTLAECARRERRGNARCGECSGTGKVPRGRRDGKEDPEQLFEPRGQEGRYRYQFALLRLENDRDLAAVLAASQHTLLQHPEAYAHATWEVYGDSPEPDQPRLYHLSVGYSLADGRRVELPPDAHLWVVAVAHHTLDRLIEATLQRWIAGWRATVAVHTGSPLYVRRVRR